MVSLLSAVSGFAAAVPRMKQVPFNTAVPRQLDAGTAAAWVLPGASIPAVSYFLASVRHEPATIGAITVLSDEVSALPVRSRSSRRCCWRRWRRGRTWRSSIRHPLVATAPGCDHGQRTVRHGTGAVASDLASLVPLVTTQGTALAWIARPTTLAAVAAGLGGASDLPRSICGISVVPAPYVPAGLLVLADLGAILVSVATWMCR